MNNIPIKTPNVSATLRITAALYVRDHQGLRREYPLDVSLAIKNKAKVLAALEAKLEHEVGNDPRFRTPAQWMEALGAVKDVLVRAWAGCVIATRYAPEKQIGVCPEWDEFSRLYFDIYTKATHQGGNPYGEEALRDALEKVMLKGLQSEEEYGKVVDEMVEEAMENVKVEIGGE